MNTVKLSLLFYLKVARKASFISSALIAGQVFTAIRALDGNKN